MREPTDSVWVCVPTYNERDNVGPLITAVLASLATMDVERHVLVIDDSSPDGTGDVVELMAKEDSRIHLLRRRKKEGIGPAYLDGFRYALAHGGTLIVEMDCDFSHSPEDLPRLVVAASTSDFVIGSRYVPGGRVEDWGMIRRAISRGGCLYAQVVLGVRVRDLTGGFKCFNRRVLEGIPLDQVFGQGYGFQVEMTYLALCAGFDVAEIPITFYDRAHGSSKMTWRIIAEAAGLVPRIRLRNARGSKKTLAIGSD